MPAFIKLPLTVSQALVLADQYFLPTALITIATRTTLCWQVMTMTLESLIATPTTQETTTVISPGVRYHIRVLNLITLLYFLCLYGLRVSEPLTLCPQLEIPLRELSQPKTHIFDVLEFSLQAASLSTANLSLII